MITVEFECKAGGVVCSVRRAATEGGAPAGHGPILHQHLPSYSGHTDNICVVQNRIVITEEYILDDPEVTANIYCKSRNLPNRIRKTTVQICGNFWVTQ